MEEKKLKEYVSKVLKEIENLEITDGMDVLSVAISHVIASAIVTDVFRRSDVEAYFRELVRRIEKAVGTVKPMQPVQIDRKKDIKIDRQSNT